MSQEWCKSPLQNRKIHTHTHTHTHIDTIPTEFNKSKIWHILRKMERIMRACRGIYIPVRFNHTFSNFCPLIFIKGICTLQ